MVDLDPQACLTFSLGYDPETLDASVHQVLLGEAPAREAVLPTEEGPDLLPATIELADGRAAAADPDRPRTAAEGRAQAAARAYDVIVLTARRRWAS